MKRKMILMTLAIAGLCFTSQAQNGQTRKASKEKRTNKFDSFANVMGLNETQKADYKKAAKERRASMKALKSEGITDKKVQREKRRTIATEFDGKLKSIFTTEQYAKYSAEKEARKKSKKAEMLKKRVDRKADSMKAKYNLSTDQHTKLKTVFTSSMQRKAEIAAKYKDSENKDAKKTEMKTLRTSIDKEIESILTTEQYAKWKADLKERRKNKKSKKK